MKTQDKAAIVKNALITAAKWVSIERTDEDNGKDVNDHLDKMLAEFREAISLIEALPVDPPLSESDRAEAVTEMYRPILEALEGVAWGKPADAGVVAGKALASLLETFNLVRKQ